MTTDNLYTSVALLERMAAYHISLTGTIRKNGKGLSINYVTDYIMTLKMYLEFIYV